MNNNLITIFKDYFPNLTDTDDEGENYINAYFKGGLYIILTLVIEKTESSSYESFFLTDNEEKTFIHESADLDELMRVTKQKLNEMFASWVSKIN